MVNVDTVEWISIKDHNTAVNALISGEVDYIESPPVDLLPLLEAADNVKARRAALAAIDQIGFLKAVIGDSRTTKNARRCSCAAPAWPPTRAPISS